MRRTRLWSRLLGVHGAIVEDVTAEEDGEGDPVSLVVSVRLPRREAGRCGICRRRSPRYDQGPGPRRWRALDLGVTPAYIEASVPRVRCREHGVVVCAVPWARHGAGHTRTFDDTAAWLATRTSKTAVTKLLRIAWRTVGNIVSRVSDDALSGRDRFAGLTRIGIDEISYKKGHRYLTVVVDHDSGLLVWAAAGRDEKTLNSFFDLLGDERCAAIALVSADAAGWIATVVHNRCQHAILCMDPFHVVQWATKALDEVRRAVWNASRRGGQTAFARDLKGARFALWKNPEDLTERQQTKLSIIAKTNDRLYRAYLLKEQLRQIFHIKDLKQAIRLLDDWLVWARRCRIPSFVRLASAIRDHRNAIEAAIANDLSNARVESINTKLRLITRIAFGFKSPDALIGLATLSLGGYCPPLPGRS